MKLCVTGGGTGGHVFPALEVALGAVDLGWQVRYLGSHRGQEKSACEKVKIDFTGFDSGPVYKPLSVKGIKSILTLLKSSGQALRNLEKDRPDALFATGGYSAAPILNAARKLKIPIVIHEQNSVPGRTNKLMSKHAKSVCSVFHATSEHLHHSKLVRTGMPIRKIMRESAQGKLMMGGEANGKLPMILVMGGSQGSASLNDLALSTALRMSAIDVQWFHITGLKHYESTLESLRKMPVNAPYTVKAYLDAEEMASALFQSSLVVCRSGAGTLSELAAFRKPSILVPYPYAFGNHQHFNAVEFEKLGAAEVVAQDSLQPAQLEARIIDWLMDKERVTQAEESLAQWDVPDSVPQILDMIKEEVAP